MLGDALEKYKDSREAKSIKGRFSNVVRHIPQSLKPRVKSDNIYFCKTEEEFREVHIVYNQKVKGSNLALAIAEATKTSATQAGFFYSKTGEMFIKPMDPAIGRRAMGKKFNLEDFYFGILSHELGHSAYPYYPNVSLESAAAAIRATPEILAQQILPMHGKNLTLKDVSFDLYGRTLQIYNKKGILIGTSLGSSDKVVEEFFADAYHVYSLFIDWSGNYKRLQENPKLLKEAIVKFGKSEEFRSLINPSNITPPQILSAAMAFDGFENLLAGLKNSQDINSNEIYVDLADEQKLALRDLVFAAQAQEVLEVYTSKIIEQAFPINLLQELNKVNNPYDKVKILLNYDASVDKQEFANAAVGVRSTSGVIATFEIDTDCAISNLIGEATEETMQMSKQEVLQRCESYVSIAQELALV